MRPTVASRALLVRRPRIRRHASRVVFAAGLASAAIPSLAETAGPRLAPVTLEMEWGAYRLRTNTVQRPNDADGDRFSALPFTGETLRTARLSIEFPYERWGEGHRVRLAYVPFSGDGTAMPAASIRYQGSRFDAGAPVDLRYTFDTWRLTYSLPVFESAMPDGRWSFRAGGTLAIRDARIRLRQGDRTEDFTNVGPVPLLHLSARRQTGPRLALEGEFDAFPAPGGGGLFDGTARVRYALDRGTSLSIGVRHIEGGAVDPQLYNYLRATALTIGLRTSF